MAGIVKTQKKQTTGKSKSSRRLKRSVRRTLGALFLVSALVVAAIPTEGLQAAPEDGVTPLAETNFQSTLRWTETNTKIPKVDANEVNIYNDADGLFQFAWVRESPTSPNYVAVILGYTGGTLENGALKIEGTVDAYAKYRANDGSTGNQVAVSRSREPLYYMSVARKPDKTHEETTVVDGENVTTTIVDTYTLPTFSPCVKEDANWDRKGDMETYYYYRYGTKEAYQTAGNPQGAPVEETTLEENVVNAASAFCGQDGNVYIRTRATEHQWIRGQTVAYIGNQYLEAVTETDTGTGTVVSEWKVANNGALNTDPTKGVFAEASNIQTLTVGKDLVGIGNYAFYNCASLRYVQFGNGLQEVGKQAFKNCANMYGVGFDFGSVLPYISDEAFAYSGLQSFTLPVGVTRIYDHAFEGCANLASIDLTGETQPPYKNEQTGEMVQPVTTLQELGCSVFKNCAALSEITLPESMRSANVHLDNFEGCSSLGHIKVLSDTTNFTPHGSEYTVEDFLYRDKTNKVPNVPETIYFEANGIAQTHIFTQENALAFKYRDDKQQYEKIIVAPNNAKLTYQVDDNSSLIYFGMSGPVDEVEIPTQIGPKNIASLGERSFADTCNLSKLIIPATVSSIGAEAFKGCHNLRHVIFRDASTVTAIGVDAFRTQEMCDTSKHNDTASSDPSLTFTGTIATNGGSGNITAPFAYAMNRDREGADNRISNASQTPTYITYYSGWPSLLEVTYNRETGKSQLENYPGITDLQSKYGTVASYPFMTQDYVEAVTTALKVYYGTGTGGGDPADETVTGYAEALYNAVQNIVLPRGIESIKQGLFVTKEGNDSQTHPDKLKTLTAYGLQEVEDGAFQGFKTLSSVNLADSTVEIGSYVFDGCEKLTSATLPMTLENIGMRPFKGCKELSNVSFGGNPRFTVADDIIYETDGTPGGAKVAVVECLERRTRSVTKTEMAGIQRLYREAFMGTGVLNVDLSSSYIERVPEFAFAYTPVLSSVTLPSTVTNVRANAFKNSFIKELTVPGANTQFADLAMGDGIYDGDVGAEDFWMNTHSYKSKDEAVAEGVGVWTEESTYGKSHISGKSDATDLSKMVLYCEPGSWAEDFADSKKIETSNDYDKTYVVNFFDEDGVTKLVDTQTVRRNEAAEAPDMTGKTNASGQVFVKWVSQPAADPDCIVADTNFVANYGNPEVELCTITFWQDFTRKESFGKAQVVKGTTKADLEASGQIPTERVENYAASIHRKFVGWVDMPEVINEDANPYAQFDALTWTVNYVDMDVPDEILYTQQVPDGADAPNLPAVKAGKDFLGWIDPLENITEDTTIRGLFRDRSETVKHTVTFCDHDGNPIDSLTQRVADGEDAVPPTGPAREGYTFTGWQPASSLKNITQDVMVVATYSQNSNNNNNGNNNGNNNNQGNNNNNNGNNNNNNNNGNNNNTASGNTTSGNTTSSNSANMYVLTVKNGSGSGSYAVGSQPVIIANDPSSGYEFSHWTVSPANTPIASTALSASIITMPASNVTVTANYKKKTGSSSGSGSSSVNSTYRPNGSTGTVTNGGTTVVIDKNGLSNTGVVSAVVNGSSDNFTIKISESAAATEAILRALVAEYGNDLSNIKYFPMDISLYDSTGTTKITDTTGLRISITLPLPDSLIPYAGNNKVAGVVNDRLDKLSPRFTTIDGVSCVTFTAEHFSPYVIYVDVSRLSDGTVADNTPKTGDGIHPKWFLSIGLACLSFVMFMQKDSKKKVKVKAKARS